MILITLRTDKPEAEIGVYNDAARLNYETWQAHRELSTTLHGHLIELLRTQQKTLQDIEGIVCFQGPGSFTGLRIGLTVANTLADSLEIPIVGSMGEDWITAGITRITHGETDKLVIPEYGGDPHITVQKK